MWRAASRRSVFHTVECCCLGFLAWELGLQAFVVPGCPRPTAKDNGQIDAAAGGLLPLDSTAPLVIEFAQAERGPSRPARLAAGFAAAATAVALALSRRRGRVESGRRQMDRTQLQGLQTGMVGLPNVGKSTLFNALCENGKADAANFPFCTIEPNVARATVPDVRLKELADMAKSMKVIPEQIEYVDIAGLVKGASKGEGLGNKFLSNIREVDAIVHVVRCFEDENITHVDGSVDPERDIETITLELILADLDQIERRLTKVQREILGQVKGAKEEKGALLKIQAALEESKPARTVALSEQEEISVRVLGLLTKKPVIYAANVAEDDLAEGNEFSERVEKVAEASGDIAVRVSAQVEAELVGLSAEDQAEFLETLGVEESGCKSLIRETYGLLGLRTYYTVGPQESRAWTIRSGWKAPQAAGVIHTDFEKNFIKAATISWDKMLECSCDEDVAKERGLLRIEGKEYEVQEGDVMHFRHNA